MNNSSENTESLIEKLSIANQKIQELEAALEEASSTKTSNTLTQTEKTLKQFGVKFQNIIDASPVPYALNDDKQNVIYLNPAFTQTFGYDINDIPTLEDWWPKAYPDVNYREWVSQTWIEHLNKAIETGEAFEPIELKIQCKNGQIRTVITSAASITDAFKDIHLVTLFDITDRQIAEAKLENTATLLDNVINSTPDLIFVKDNQLKTILCNLACANAVGKSREEMYGNTDIENGWDPDLVMGNAEKGIRGFMHDDRDALAGIPIHNPNDPANVDGTILTFDTRKLPLKDSHGNIIGLLGVARDITERQLAAEALQEANTELDATLKAIPDTLFELDEEGRYLKVWANDENLLTDQKATLIGKRINDALPEDAVIEINKALYIAGKEGSSHGQIIQLQLENGEHWFELSTALKPSKDKLKHFIMLSRNITARINTEHQLRRSQKMDALGKLTGGIAHDFNNMLGVILGYSELMEMSIKDEKHSRYTREIIQAANRAKTLTSKLLAFAKKLPSDAQATNMNNILKRDKNMLETTLTAKINLILKLDNKLWKVFVAPELLADAVLNLSINSMHAMPAGGDLILETHNLHIEEALAYSLSLEPGDYVQLTVTDTGCGMDNHVKEHIFEPFYSTKGESGTGLGLSQVYGFTQQSKSQIIIDSIIDQGTSISIYFPRYTAAETLTQSDINSTHQKTASNNESILVVDDEEALRSLASDILGTQGYTVLCAESGVAALDILQQNKIDLMMTDVIMPDMDGYQLSHEVKQQFPQMKILVSSGYSDELQLAHKDQDLEEKQLNKPYKSSELISKVRELLDE